MHRNDVEESFKKDTKRKGLKAILELERPLVSSNSRRYLEPPSLRVINAVCDSHFKDDLAKIDLEADYSLKRIQFEKRCFVKKCRKLGILPVYYRGQPVLNKSAEFDRQRKKKVSAPRKGKNSQEEVGRNACHRNKNNKVVISKKAESSVDFTPTAMDKNPSLVTYKILPNLQGQRPITTGNTNFGFTGEYVVKNGKPVVSRVADRRVFPKPLTRSDRRHWTRSAVTMSESWDRLVTCQPLYQYNVSSTPDQYGLNMVKYSEFLLQDIQKCHYLRLPHNIS